MRGNTEPCFTNVSFSNGAFFPRFIHGKLLTDRVAESHRNKMKSISKGIDWLTDEFKMLDKKLYKIEQFSKVNVAPEYL